MTATSTDRTAVRPETLAGRYLFALGIAGAALAVGTVHTATLCAVTGVLGVATVLVWWGAEPIKMRSAATLLLFTALALTVYTALQSVAMPARWLAALAPHNADVWSRALVPLGERGPAWAPISLDPTATHVEVLRGVAYALAFVTALRLARRREGVKFLSAVVILTGLALAGAALLHPAFGVHKLFGLYEPTQGIAERHIAPLMNPNNLAGYLNLALCLALAGTLAPEPPAPRAVMGALVILLGGTQIWVASRGGVGAMGVGVVTVLAIARFTRTDRRRALLTTSLVAGAAAAMGAVLIVLGSSEDTSAELFDSDVSKLKLFGRVMRMLPAMPFFGCGRGAFESAFPAFRTEYGHFTYSHPENVIAQWVLEWGLPVGIAGLAAIAFSLRPTEMFARSTTAGGAWAGLVALALQNLGDLGTEVPGLLLAGVLCAAIVVAGTPGRTAGWRGAQWASHPRGVAVAAGAAATLSIFVAARGLNGELASDRAQMHDAALDPHLPTAAMHDMARAAILRHPAEPYLPFAAALHASHQANDNATPWLGAALERAPVYAPAHLILARAVASRAPSQARTEYRLTLEEWPDLTDYVMVEAPRVVGSYDDAIELVPPGKEGVPVLASLVGALQSRLPAACVRLDAELTSLSPNDSGAALRAASAAVEDVEMSESPLWCSGTARNSCVDRALRLTDRAQRIAPTSCSTHAIAARLQIAIGNVAGGLKNLAEATDVVKERVECLRQLAVLAGQAGDGSRESEAIANIANAGCSEDAECARNLAWVGGLEEKRGNALRALTLYKRAHEKAPDDDGLLEGMARLAAAIGLHAEAAGYYDLLDARHPGQERWKNAAKTERDEAIKRAVRL